MWISLWLQNHPQVFTPLDHTCCTLSLVETFYLLHVLVLKFILNNYTMPWSTSKYRSIDIDIDTQIQTQIFAEVGAATMEAPPYSPSSFPVKLSGLVGKNLSKPFNQSSSRNRDFQRNVSLFGGFTWQLLWLTLSWRGHGSCLKVRGAPTPQPTPMRTSCPGDTDFDVKISAVVTSLKKHSSYISPDHEVVVVRDPKIFTISVMFQE